MSTAPSQQIDSQFPSVANLDSAVNDRLSPGIMDQSMSFQNQVPSGKECPLTSPSSPPLTSPPLELGESVRKETETSVEPGQDAAFLALGAFDGSLSSNPTSGLKRSASEDLQLRSSKRLKLGSGLDDVSFDDNSVRMVSVLHSHNANQQNISQVSKETRGPVAGATTSWTDLVDGTKSSWLKLTTKIAQEEGKNSSMSHENTELREKLEATTMSLGKTEETLSEFKKDRDNILHRVEALEGDLATSTKKSRKMQMSQVDELQAREGELRELRGKLEAAEQKVSKLEATEARRNKQRQREDQIEAGEGKKSPRVLKKEIKAELQVEFDKKLSAHKMIHDGKIEEMKRTFGEKTEKQAVNHKIALAASRENVRRLTAEASEARKEKTRTAKTHAGQIQKAKGLLKDKDAAIEELTKELEMEKAESDERIVHLLHYKSRLKIQTAELVELRSEMEQQRDVHTEREDSFVLELAKETKKSDMHYQMVQELNRRIVRDRRDVTTISNSCNRRDSEIERLRAEVTGLRDETTRLSPHHMAAGGRMLSGVIEGMIDATTQTDEDGTSG